MHMSFIDWSVQKPIKTFEKSSRGRSQGLAKIFKALIYTAHRAVILAIAQLSCFIQEERFKVNGHNRMRVLRLALALWI